MPVPPTLVRRLVIAPLVALAEVALIAVSPLLAPFAAVASPFTGGSWRPLRVLALTVEWAAFHLTGMLACLRLWVTGGASSANAYDDVLRRYIGAVNRAAMRRARVRVRICDSEAAAEVLSAHERPVVVLSRHAGEGDSLLVLHALMCGHGRRPRVVLHEALRLDPLLDVLGHRLGYRFIDPRGGDIEDEIAAMARTLPDDGAVLIFPEGGNFSPARRRRGIDRLAEAGHDEEAQLAREMEHVAAPRPGGALAAIDALPSADVVFVGHVGIPAGISNLWQLLLGERTVRVRMWVARASEVPADRDAQIDWLFQWWGTIDDWVDEQEG